jgi:hypothetical protein
MERRSQSARASGQQNLLGSFQRQSRREAHSFPGCPDYKAIPWANFQNFGALTVFEFGRIREGIEGVPFSKATLA